mgnify:CR=1 FL=1
MKKYYSSFGRQGELVHPAPERTGVRTLPGIFGDLEFQVWPNRKALARSIRMQQRRESRPGDWHAVVRLTDGEGY